MLYYIVDHKLVNGAYETDVDSNDVYSAIPYSEGKYILAVRDTAVVRQGWQQATATDFNNALPLDQVKASKMSELDQSYKSCFTIFQSNALGVTKTYPINGEAQDNLKDLQQRLIADPNKNNFDFLTIEDGILVSHTRIQFLELLQDAETFEVTLHNKYRGYANQVSVATDIPTVQDIKWA